LWSTLRFLACPPFESSTLEKTIQFGSAAVIIFENAFYLLDHQRYLKQEPSVCPVRVALQQYIASPNVAAVREALSSAVRTYEAGVSQWIVESAKHSQKKADLIRTIIEVVLQHRLRM
ncbi:hypothetical protein P692DRAFT_20719146, partial [Suillus brevipes Sb2]